LFELLDSSFETASPARSAW